MALKDDIEALTARLTAAEASIAALQAAAPAPMQIRLVELAAEGGKTIYLNTAFIKMLAPGPKPDSCYVYPADSAVVMILVGESVASVRARIKAS